MEALTEAHWSYLDRFAGQLILRGPTGSDDATEHTGSVHVVNLPDRASAERFAADEPFWRAGLYAQVMMARAVVLLHREPVHDPLGIDAPSALVTGDWPARPGGAHLPWPGDGPDSRIRFVAALVTDDESATTGVISVVSAALADAARVMRPFADELAGAPVALTAQRWERGGRR